MKHFLSFLCLLGATSLTAQNSLDTYEACDANLDGSVSVADATSVVNHALYATSPGTQVVTAKQLNAVLQKIEGELAALRSHAGLPEPGGSTPSANASFQFTSKSMHIGDTFTQEVSTISDGTVSYLSTNPSVAIVDETSGLVSAVANGETTIIATVAATSNYPVASAAYNVLVEAASMHMGHEYVDLGLPSGLKWATCNVGASAPEEYGDYYAWGEVETKSYSYYTKATYKYFHIETDADGFGSEELWDDLGDISGTEYDVAHQKWEGSWRMPTRIEFCELHQYCTWTWCAKNAIYGYKVTGTNGNWIFLPATGCCDGKLVLEGSYGYYWSSTQDPDYSSDAYGMFFSSSYIDPSSISYKHVGRCVRPVTE